LEISNLTKFSSNLSIQIKKECYQNLKFVKESISKTKQKKVMNLNAISNLVSLIELTNNKKMMKVQLINNTGNIAIDLIIWKHNSQFKTGFSYNFNTLTFEEDLSSCRLYFNKCSQFQEVNEEKISIKPIFLNLSMVSDLIMYSTYNGFEQTSDGWNYGRILNITFKNNFCFKVNVKLDNKDKICFFTAIEKELLSPSNPTTSTIETISKDIGKTKKFTLHLKKKKI
jgi:hypothetical protein